jgi:hypothetical protein
MVACDSSARVGGVLGHLLVVAFLLLHAVFIACGCGAHTRLHAPECMLLMAVCANFGGRMVYYLGWGVQALWYGTASRHVVDCKQRASTVWLYVGLDAGGHAPLCFALEPTPCFGCRTTRVPACCTLTCV